MATPVNQFSYHLPGHQIAQTPAVPRESAKLMILNRQKHTITHDTVASIPKYLVPGDVVVVNNTKVFKARLHGMIDGKLTELFLVRPVDGFSWLALAKPGKRCKKGQKIVIADDFCAIVTHKNSDGTIIVSFTSNRDTVISKANQYGSVPVPPYIKTIPKEGDYQTSYAKKTGSVAAPTAGFHITPAIMDELKKKRITVLEITLHVGLGTFLPIKTDTIESHTMHNEWVEVTAEVASAIKEAKKENRRIIAVGTTTVRTLEGIAANNDGTIVPYQGDINLFITPGFPFRIVDSMLTNFHLPKSTLIVLVSAFGGREFILHAYEEAVKNNYRFYSFGDAMLIF